MLTAFILCAGEGKRLMPLTAVTPKPLILVNGKPIVDYAIDNLRSYGVTKFIVNTSYLPQEIIEYLGDDAIFSYEDKPLGTAGAIRKVLPWLGDNFIVTNGDTITNVNYKKMIISHLRKHALITIFTKDTATHNGGSFIFNKNILHYIPKNKPYSIHEDLIPHLLDSWVTDRVNLYKSDAYYYDCGNIEKLNKVREIFKR